MEQGRALVTGASRGIGRATCIALADAGWRVIAGVRDQAAAADAFAGRAGIETVRLDVTDEASIADAIGVARAAGGLDLLVNNAGYALFAVVEEADLDEVRAMFETNFFGALATTQAALPLLREGGGLVVNVTSLGARATSPVTGLYAATKAALRSTSEALAMEGAAHGVRVVMVEPGMVDTEFPQATRRSGPAASGEGPYAPLAGELIASFRRWREQHPTPPEAVADAIVAAVAAEDPPFHLPVGEDAVRMSDLRRQVSDGQYLMLVAEFLGLDSLRP
jgi:NAD(P)-dependent dehydrogenase (short-subunit alcohol dehydrogenase family)